MLGNSYRSARTCLHVLSVFDPDDDVGNLAQSVEPKVDVHHLNKNTERAGGRGEHTQKRTEQGDKVIGRNEPTKSRNERTISYIMLSKRKKHRPNTAETS